MQSEIANKPKDDPIPVVFHNLKGYDTHNQAMPRLQKEVKCIGNDMEKYITIRVGEVRSIDSLNLTRS